MRSFIFLLTCLMVSGAAIAGATEFASAGSGVDRTRSRVATRPVSETATPGPARKAALDGLFHRLKLAGDESEARGIADRIWRIWFETDNADVAALMTRVQMARRAGLGELALEELGKIIAIAPEYVEGWNQRATVLFLLGRDDQSVNDIQQVLRLEPRHFGALAGLGLIHMRAENWQAAIASFERALELHPYLAERALLPALRKKLKGQPL